jgi:hypothetical protein
MTKAWNLLPLPISIIYPDYIHRRESFINKLYSLDTHIAKRNEMPRTLVKGQSYLHFLQVL